MNKYFQLLVKNVKKQLETWLNEKEVIQHKEVYRFLHSIAGTASTIGFTVAGDMARKLMGQLNLDEEREWKKEDLQSFLLPLISIIYYEEYSNIDEIIERKSEYEDKKLILLIDDDTALLMYLKEKLEENDWIVIAVADPDRAINSYYDLNPSCVIIDIHMKDKNGLDVLLQLKEKMKQQFIPTIMISNDQSKELRIKSYKLGTDDFIHKPIDIEEFVVRINRQLERKQAIDNVMLIDELTRVYNRKFLPQTYDRFVSSLNRRRQPFCMALLDLDHFKNVNDTYGHIVGDEVLATFADTVRKGLRINDIIIRYGGEEFIILLPETKTREAKLVLERILKEFSNIPFEANDEEFYCSFSSGIHEVQSNETDLKKNIEIADAALYEAKQAGRNQIKVAAVHNLEIKKKPIHVGIVDDDPIIRTMLEDLISKSKIMDDFTVDIQTFKDGMEFIEADWHLKNNEQFLIILDGMMPRMDGLEVLQKLRALPYQERFTVMMLTSRKSEHDITRALKLGADDYITKPFKLLELETRLGHLIKRMK
ncbi:diguanylate cyclase [Bacillus sp. UMB0899]|uniref:GGDEF domain-containing response regulator n=1 Tax=Metabacillus schmidteae TaxID=2730405 RepID=UPI000C8021B6|nr:diguanylate cyclase [Metabacillus schmidteae]PMC40673.1 diguanylate cyclase [Bacillus sp. UMB0899]